MSERKSQMVKVVEYLRARGWVSAMDLLKGTNVICYTRRITDARRAGYKIELRWLYTYGGKRYSEYRLVS